MTEQDTFHFTIAALTASQVYQVPITQAMKQQIGRDQVFDTLAFYNGCDKMLFVQLNNNSDERYPVAANGGQRNWDKNDNIKFSTVQIVESSGANATGSSYLTIAKKGN